MKRKKTNKCSFEGCKNLKHINCLKYREKYCSFHRRRATIGSFLSNAYSRMNERIKGTGTRNPHLYANKPIVSREIFVLWSKNHPDFLRLYKSWVNTGFDRRFAPSVNRLSSKGGYTLDNMEWVTFSQNCKMASAVRDLNYKKEIYRLIGVKR